MIPYFQFIKFYIGPLPINIWGLCVALGIIAAILVTQKFAGFAKLEKQRIFDMSFWVVLISLLGGRLFFVISELSFYLQDPWAIFKVWEGGMSIFGGFIGAIIVAIIYLKKHKLPVLPYFDAVIFGLPLGLGIGRLGCFFIFDHPGIITNFFLGERYLDGLVRHNLGLYLSLNGFLLSLIFFWLFTKNRQRFAGFYTIFFLGWYGLTRFCLDFLRSADLAVSDPRYFSLTLAQFLSILMIVGSFILWYYVKHLKPKEHERQN